MSKFVSRWLRCGLVLWWCVVWPLGLCAQPLPTELAGAAPPEPALLDALAAHPTWRRLLHMPTPGAGLRSQVNSPDFFLAPTGPTDPRAELQATLAAYHQPWPQDANLHPRCRFPGRYFWLQQQAQQPELAALAGALPGYRVDEPRCARLQAWARLGQLRSASVFMVSGYFGNPASAFGHALLRFNTQEGQRLGGKLDVSLNFGAMVPPKESTLAYVFKGLTGGYQAGFSDQPFYTNDLMYSHTEFRDMWEYELRLAPTELQLLVLHTAEVAGKSFDYYFLNRNCALRLAELLELATGREVVGSAWGWYIPVEMFHALHRLDAPPQRILSGPPRFVPSAQRVLWHEFSQLNPAQQQVAEQVVEQGLAGLSAALAPLPPGQRLDVLDTLLAWQAYRLIAAEPTPPPELRRDKDQLLLARLQQPARQRPALPLLDEPSPAQGHAPMLWGVGVARGSGAAQGTQTVLRWSLFDYAAGGFHGLGSNEMAAFETELRWPQGQRLKIEQLDVLRVRKLNTQTALVTEVPWSWQVRLGAERVPAAGGDAAALRPLASFGVGRAWELPSFLKLGVLLDARWRVADGSATLGPVLVWDWPFGNPRGDWRLAGDWAQRQPLLNHTLPAQQQGRAMLTWRLARDTALQWRWQQQAQQRQLVVELQQFW